MHVAPVLVIPHGGDPGEWAGTFRQLAASLQRHRTLEVTVRAPGAVLEHMVREEDDVWSSLDLSRIRWLAGGFSDPILTLLPPRAVDLQLERETVAMDAAGVAPTGLWVGDTWEPSLVDTALASALPLVYVLDTLTDGGLDRPAPVERAGHAVLAVPVFGKLPELPGDGLATVLVEASDLDPFVESHRGSITSPDEYLVQHLPGGRTTLPVAGPAPSASREAFYRRLLVLTDDQGERRPGREALLRFQSREYLVDGAGSEMELIEARRGLDKSRHRGDAWVESRDLDWDADGLPEVWIGTASHTVVVDPPTAQLDIWDDRSEAWPILSVEPPLPGLLVRRLTEDGEEPPPPRLAVEGRSEGRSHASVVFSDPTVGSCRLEITGRTLSLELALDTSSPMRVGPEFPLNLGQTSLRADGGEWVVVDEPIALTGHRFRFTDGSRTMLVAAPRPCEMFVRPSEGRGIVIWPHWMIRDGGTYRLALTPS